MGRCHRYGQCSRAQWSCASSHVNEPLLSDHHVCWNPPALDVPFPWGFGEFRPRLTRSFCLPYRFGGSARTSAFTGSGSANMLAVTDPNTTLSTVTTILRAPVVTSLRVGRLSAPNCR